MDNHSPESFNPYRSPATAPPYSSPSAFPVPDNVIAELMGTKPWVRFFGILLWLGVALMTVGSLGMFAMSGAALLWDAQASQETAIGMSILAVFYLIAAGILVYPALRLNGYAGRIQDLAQSRNSDDLVASLSEQRRFWRFYGLSMIAYFVLLLIAGMVAAIIPAAFQG